MLFLIFLGLILSCDVILSQKLDIHENDGSLCNRDCVEGENRICYFKFVLEHYHAMGPACGRCAWGNYEDCFNDQCVIGDMTEKGCQTINRQIPGPPIHVCKNDIVVVDVANFASGTAATLHWHGMHMRDTPFMDGVPFVTQCPIIYGNTFRYNFNASEPGTHFYHSHSGHHKINGQYGALIVREPIGNDPNILEYDVDSPGHDIVLSDWQHSYGEQLFPGLPSYGGIFPDSVLINGIGTYLNVTTHRRFQKRSRKRLPRGSGKAPSFRLINSISHACPFQIQVEDHTMVVIASDGFNVKPKIVDTLVINSGERYDFVVNANRPFGDYWIRVRGLGTCAIHPIESYALLRYINNANDKNEIVDFHSLKRKPSYNLEYPSGVVLNHPNASCFSCSDHCVTELEAHDVDEELYSAEPNKVFFLSFNNYVVSNEEIFKKGFYRHFVNLGGNLTINGAMSGISMTYPTYPPLTQPENIDESHFCDENNLPAYCQNKTICPCIHRIKVNLGDIVELVIVDDNNTPGRMHHPFHLHGFRFMVKDMGQHPLKIPMTVPLARSMRDTITIPSYGYAIFRFRADNPGFWLMHCHYEWHVHIGMGLLVQVGEVDQMVKAPNGFPKCGDFVPDI
uniref:Uncharacterized protein n=1 Tax=Megaselia scalaris TaxID=36166 RepID=T1GHN8_MEGSC